jgi:cytochrome c
MIPKSGNRFSDKIMLKQKLHHTIAAEVIMIARIAVTFALSLAAFAALAQDDGQILFNNSCRTCHSVKDGDNRLGPNLHGIVGRKSGALTNYGYSYSMANADIVWDKTTLDRFIANPEVVVRGNNMQPYGGMPSAADRAKLIAYLEASH